MNVLLKVLTELVGRVAIGVGSVCMTLAFFLVLPLIQAIADKPVADTQLSRVDTQELEAPEAPPEEELEEPEPEEEPPPPELAEESRPMELSQLEAAMNASGFGSGVGAAAFKLDIGANLAGGGLDLASMGDFDQEPRILMRPAPTYPAKLRSRAPATVKIKFLVDTNGRVKLPRVASTTDPAFNRSALDCVKQWKFEPATHKGQAVEYPMLVPITFPKD